MDLVKLRRKQHTRQPWLHQSSLQHTLALIDFDWLPSCKLYGKCFPASAVSVLGLASDCASRLWPGLAATVKPRSATALWGLRATVFQWLGKNHINIPSGGIPRQRFERFEKKCRFRHSETTDSFPEIGLNFPGFWSVFWWWPVIYREFVPEKVRGVFPRDQWAPKDFWSWSSSNAIATPWCFASILG